MKLILKFKAPNPIGVLKDLYNRSLESIEHHRNQCGGAGSLDLLHYKKICTTTASGCGEYTFTAKVEGGTPIVECLFEGLRNSFYNGAASVACADDLLCREDCILTSVELVSSRLIDVPVAPRGATVRIAHAVVWEAYCYGNCSANKAAKLLGLNYQQFKRILYGLDNAKEDLS